MTTFDILEKHKFYRGRMISGSKSGYSIKHPDNIVYFNANIITNDGKVWFGDLDLTLDESELKKIAKESGQDLFILSEMDARFDKEDDSIEKLKSRARAIFDKDGETVWHKERGTY